MQYFWSAQWLDLLPFVYTTAVEVDSYYATPFCPRLLPDWLLDPLLLLCKRKGTWRIEVTHCRRYRMWVYKSMNNGSVVNHNCPMCLSIKIAEPKFISGEFQTWSKILIFNIDEWMVYIRLAFTYITLGNVSARLLKIYINFIGRCI